MMRLNSLVDELRQFLFDKGINYISGYTQRGSKITEFWCFDDKIKQFTNKPLKTQYHRIYISKKFNNFYYCSFQPLFLKTYK
jgi:hypothetical protein